MSDKKQSRIAWYYLLPCSNWAGSGGSLLYHGTIDDDGDAVVLGEEVPQMWIPEPSLWVNSRLFAALVAMGWQDAEWAPAKVGWLVDVKWREWMRLGPSPMEFPREMLPDGYLDERRRWPWTKVSIHARRLTPATRVEVTSHVGATWTDKSTLTCRIDPEGLCGAVGMMSWGEPGILISQQAFDGLHTLNGIEDAIPWVAFRPVLLE